MAEHASSEDLLERAWSQRWLVTALWWLCAIWAVAAVKHEEHKCMLMFISNVAIGFPLTIPFAMQDCTIPLRSYWRLTLLIAVSAALERTLSNSSMYSIGASLKTALHGSNVLLTFLVSGLMGVGSIPRSCLLQCRCQENLLMFPALIFISVGGLATAMCGQADWHSTSLGVLMQLASSLAYAVKFVLIKYLLSGESILDSDGHPVPKPSKWQLALVTFPIQGLVGLAFLPIFESSWALPGLCSSFSLALAATGILMFELRLTELTSPLTVSVLAVLHNIAIVAYFILICGEILDHAQLYGFLLSSVGAMLYAWISNTNVKVEAFEPLPDDNERRPPVLRSESGDSLDLSSKSPRLWQSVLVASIIVSMFIVAMFLLVRSPPSSNALSSEFLFNFCVAGVLGALAKTISAPIDRVKVLMQTQDVIPRIVTGDFERFTGIGNCLVRLYENEGLHALWRGNLPNLIRYIALTAFNFSFKSAIEGFFPVYSPKNHFMKLLLVNLISGAFAGALSLTIVYPLDYVRTRLAGDIGRDNADECADARKFAGLLDCVSKTVRSQGLLALYSGYFVSVIGIAIYRALYFGLFDTYIALSPHKNLVSTSWYQMISGLTMSFFIAHVTTALAVFASYPFDTVRRRMQMEADLPGKRRTYTNLITSWRVIIHAEGVSGMYKGISANFVRIVVTAIMLVVFLEITDAAGISTTIPHD